MQNAEPTDDRRSRLRRLRVWVCEAASGVAFAITLFCAIVARAADAPSSQPFVLFDGQSLTGWHQAGPAGFDLNDGVLTAHGGMGLLWHDRELGDFRLRLEFKV